LKRQGYDVGNEKLNELISRLRRRLVDYLVLCERLPLGELDPKTKISCLHPEHEDKNPSMGLIPLERTGEDTYTLLRCWSHGHVCDIFKACSWLEGKPESGPEWVRENVYYLADLLGETYERVPESAANLERAKVLRLYEDAADCLLGLLHTAKSQDPFEHTSKRGLSREICLEYGVGTVRWEEFLLVLQRYGDWDEEFIRDHEITERMFNTEFITITLRDHRGQVCGFDRRFVYHDSEEEKKAHAEGRPYPQKFCRTGSKVGTMPEIFFFGLDQAKDVWRRLDIVEGYFDVLSAVQAGHRSIVAACGTSTLKDVHFDFLVRLGFKEVALIHDEDEAGQTSALKAIDKFGKRPDIRLFLIRLGFEDEIPPKDRDPDTFFRLYGWKNFEKMPVHSAFLVKLATELKKGVRGSDLVRSVIPELAAEPDAIRRGQMIRDLAFKTEIHEEDIREEVARVLSGQAQKVTVEVVRALEKHGKSPDDVRAILSEAADKIGRFTSSRQDNLGKNAAIANFYRTLDQFNNNRGALAGYRTGISLFDTYMSGFQKNTFLVIGGTPNAGKSALLYYLIHGMLAEEEATDHCLLVHSLDDSYQYAFAKLLATHLHVPIGWCAEPHRYIFPHEDRSRQYREAVDFYMAKMGDSIQIFGGESGMSMDTILRSVKRTQDETGRHVTLFLDSFHNVWGIGGEEDGVRYKNNAKRLHHLAATGTSVAITSECNKSAQGGKPRLKDLSETRAISYDANLVLLPYNDLNENRDKAELFWVSRDSVTGKPVKKPVIELEVEKNKLTDFKGKFYFQFVDNECRFVEIEDPKRFILHQLEEWQRLTGDRSYEILGDGDIVRSSGIEVSIPTPV